MSTLMAEQHSPTSYKNEGAVSEVGPSSWLIICTLRTCTGLNCERVEVEAGTQEPAVATGLSVVPGVRAAIERCTVH